MTKVATPAEIPLAYDYTLAASLSRSNSKARRAADVGALALAGPNGVVVVHPYVDLPEGRRIWGPGIACHATRIADALRSGRIGPRPGSRDGETAGCLVSPPPGCRVDDLRIRAAFTDALKALASETGRIAVATGARSRSDDEIGRQRRSAFHLCDAMIDDCGMRIPESCFYQISWKAVAAIDAQPGRVTVLCGREDGMCGSITYIAADHAERPHPWDEALVERIVEAGPSIVGILTLERIAFDEVGRRSELACVAARGVRRLAGEMRRAVAATGHLEDAHANAVATRSLANLRRRPEFELAA